ncbi:hypothetical protein [Methanococcoides sp. FTZ1]|uniref:hypothetical protein n=1 Tax=Methanococcoides sp. FTZ1 TaxID=3439061 RepID=UPI003F84373E
MTGEYPSSVQSSSSASKQGETGTRSHVITQMAQRASEDQFLIELDVWINTAHNWMKVAKGPVINVTLTEIQKAEVTTVIKTLEGVKKMYEEMNDD